MGCNKRYFSMDLLVQRYKEDPEMDIENAVGKTDVFFFNDEKSHEIISLWLADEDEKANEKLEEYVSRIFI